jgi:hypothetical protein
VPAQANLDGGTALETRTAGFRRLHILWLDSGNGRPFAIGIWCPFSRQVWFLILEALGLGPLTPEADDDLVAAWEVATR